MKSENHYKNMCQVKEIINYCDYEGGGEGRIPQDTSVWTFLASAYLSRSIKSIFGLRASIGLILVPSKKRRS